MLTQVRKAVLLVASVALILVLGVVAAWGHLTTASRVQGTQRSDRLQLQGTLGGLTGQYLEFAFLDTQRAADAVAWNLRAGDAADKAALERTARSSHLNSYGATLTTALGQPLTSYARGPLPSPLDPGFRPLREALLAGRPGLSDVMHAGPNAIVAFAVPVRQAGAVVGLLISYADVRSWPLQGYDASLHLGSTAAPYVLDANGTVAASGQASVLGTHLSGLPARALAGGSAVVNVTYGGVASVLSYAPAGQGWTSVTIQSRAAFSGGLQARSQRDAVALVVLLTLVVLLLVWFNFARQQALRRLADERLQDPLTGLAQRRLFHLRLESALARQRRSGAPLAVLYCDLDAFKAVNDTFGHNVGDQLLVAVAERLREATREDDLVARLGGDEFAVVLEASDAEQTREVLSRLKAAVERPLTLSGHELHPRVAVGAAVLRDPERADDLLAEADLAMYRVKHGTTSQPIVVLRALQDNPEAAAPLLNPPMPAPARAERIAPR